MFAYSFFRVTSQSKRKFCQCLLPVTALFLSACSMNSSTQDVPVATVKTYFDYQLTSPKGDALSLSAFVEATQNADVVLIGEWHTHTGIHRFQTELLRAMSVNNNALALSMEQFSRDKQFVVNEYLAGDIGEKTLIKAGNAWPNYTSDYRPLVELAKSQEIDIIAANAPKRFVRCIAKEGIGYVDTLPADEREWLAQDISTQSTPYKIQFMASMHHGDESKNENMFASQVTWDETMAESIVNYLAGAEKGTQVMHIAGKFHTENGLGTAASILARNPKLNVVIVTPVAAGREEKQKSNDYLLEVLSPPKAFVKKENMMASYKALGNRNKDLVCD